MIEISTDPDGTVYVRWATGGIWTVLSKDGCVGRCGLGGTNPWSPVNEQVIPHQRIATTTPRAATR